jgi:hypothetical protein
MCRPTEQGTPFQTPEQNLFADMEAEILSPADIREAEQQVTMWSAHPRIWIPFDLVMEDEQMKKGQSRTLDNDRVVRYMAAVQAHTKLGPLEDLLAVPSAQRGMFVVRDVAYPLALAK